MQEYDIEEAILAVFKDPLWQPSFDVVWDCRDIDKLLLDLRDIDRLVKLMGVLRRRKGRGRSAVLTTGELDYTVARLLFVRSATPAREVSLFESANEAAAWLNLEEGFLSPS